MSEQRLRLSRRHFVAGVGAILVVLGAGAWAWLGPARKGEHASYTTWTRIKPGLTDAKIHRTDQGGRLLYARSRVALTRGPAFGGIAYMADTGHRVPDEIEIIWRKWPREGQDWYDSDPVDPVRMKVRSRIPTDIFEQAAKRGHMLEISFGIGQERVSLNWRLVKTEGWQTLQSGGD